MKNMYGTGSINGLSFGFEKCYYTENVLHDRQIYPKKIRVPGSGGHVSGEGGKLMLQLSY
jgi:hypothetical protein